MQEQDRGATSVRPDGECASWKLIWNCPVPPKVKTLAWKICRNALATKVNLKYRRITHSDMCDVCGMEAEDTYHVFLRCPHARSLWLVMRETWNLPADDLLRPTGPHWLLQLLTEIKEEQRAPTLMTLWRIWHAHNEITHDKPCPSIEGSRRFLVSYLNSLLMVKQFPDADVIKGKMVIDQDGGFKTRPDRVDGRKKVRKRWDPPNENEAKLNVDGAFVAEGGA